MKLTPESVETIMRACIAQADGAAATAIVEGITNNFGFSQQMLEKHRSDIQDLAAQLPDEFHADKGGGWTFLNLCTDRDGNLWTGMHSTMECLCCLAIGAGIASWVLPREFWEALPGKVPYVQFNTVKALLPA